MSKNNLSFLTFHVSRHTRCSKKNNINSFPKYNDVLSRWLPLVVIIYSNNSNLLNILINKYTKNKKKIKVNNNKIKWINKWINKQLKISRGQKKTI